MEEDEFFSFPLISKSFTSFPVNTNHTLFLQHIIACTQQLLLEDDTYCTERGNDYRRLIST